MRTTVQPSGLEAPLTLVEPAPPALGLRDTCGLRADLGRPTGLDVLQCASRRGSA